MYKEQIDTLSFTAIKTLTLVFQEQEGDFVSSGFVRPVARFYLRNRKIECLAC
jgi:hypothetical protein